MEGDAMRQKAPAAARAGAGEDGSAQVTVGSFTIEIGKSEGALVRINEPKNLPSYPPRLEPARVLPRPERGLLDRQREMGLALAALRGPAPTRLEFCGPPGSGKTALLHSLAHHPVSASFPDGVIYQSSLSYYSDDLLQVLFDCFYERPEGAHPGPARLRQALAAQRALILLDDADLPSPALADLFTTLRHSAFVLASTQRRLAGPGQTILIGPLPWNAACALVEQEQGRTLPDDERRSLLELWAALQGNPQRLLQAVALAGESGRSLEAVWAGLQSGSDPARMLGWQVLASLSSLERRVVFVLAGLDGLPLAEGHLAALTGIPDLRSCLDKLVKWRVVRRQGPGYSLAGNLGRLAPDIWDLSAWIEHVTGYFIRWADARPGEPVTCEEAGVLLHLMRWTAETQRWVQALRLAWVVEGPLAQLGWWGAWEDALQVSLQAAQALGGRAAAARALHQAGSRALCLGEFRQARALLIRALQQREALGKGYGASATRRNLAVLLEMEARIPRRKLPAAVRESPALPSLGRERLPAARSRRAWGLLAWILVLLAALALTIPAAGLGF